MKELRTVSVVDALTESLRDRVLDGDIEAGTTLTESEVATDYAVSRPTAKSAMVQLVAEGLLRREAHKTAFVPLLGGADVADLFLVRTPLELEAVSLLSADPPDLSAAAAAVSDLRGLSEDVAHHVFVEADLRFHRVLIGAVGSPRLARVYESLTGEIHLYMVQSRSALGRARIVREHAAVLAAVKAGDAARATAAMSTHLAGARDALLASLAG